MKKASNRSRVLDYVRQNSDVSRSKVAQDLCITLEQASNTLAHLKAEGKLFSNGSGPATTWTSIPPEQPTYNPANSIWQMADRIATA